MRRIACWCLALAATAVGCSSGSSGGGSQAPAPTTAVSATTASTGAGAAPARRGGSGRITAEEIAQHDFKDAREVIERLRPQQLRGRGSVTLSDATGESTLPIVYVDNSRFGTIETLRSIPAMQIREIQFISNSDATTRWGTGHTGGVILILTKGGR